jgi:hypothetical protein
MNGHSPKKVWNPHRKIIKLSGSEQNSVPKRVFNLMKSVDPERTNRDACLKERTTTTQYTRRHGLVTIPCKCGGEADVLILNQ